MRHTISVLVENEFGVLARVAGLFSGRGFNIESLSVAETLDPTISRLTLVTRGDDQVLEQIEKQLNKLVNVIRVTDFTGTEHVERELVLIKVAATGMCRSDCQLMEGYFPLATAFPIIPGHEVAGRIAAVGADVPRAAGLSEGDLVLAVDGSTVATLEAFYKRLWDRPRPDADVKLTVLQGAELRTLVVKPVDRMQTMRKASGI